MIYTNLGAKVRLFSDICKFFCKINAICTQKGIKKTPTEFFSPARRGVYSIICLPLPRGVPFYLFCWSIYLPLSVLLMCLSLRDHSGGSRGVYLRCLLPPVVVTPCCCTGLKFSETLQSETISTGRSFTPRFVTYLRCGTPCARPA